MLKILAWALNVNLLLGLASGYVTQCYHCNSEFCGDTYDSRLGAISSCSDIYTNTMGRLLASNSSDLVNDEDIETFAVTNSTGVNNTQVSARFFDFQRKIWELFNKGDFDQNAQFVCVTASYSESGKYLTYRGCVPKYTKTITTACDFVNQKVTGASTGTVYSCYTCESNLCNSGMALKSSLLAIITLALLKYV